LDHFFQRGTEILQIPLQDQGNLDTDKAGQHKGIGLQLGRIQEGQNALIFFLQEKDALIHQHGKKIVPDNDIKQAFFLFPVRKIAGNGSFLGIGFGNIGGQLQNTFVELPADDGPEAAVLVRKVVIEGFPGDAQLVAQVGNADRGIRPQQKIFKQTFLDLFLAAIGCGGIGNLCMIHFLLHFGDISYFMRIPYYTRKPKKRQFPENLATYPKNRYNFLIETSQKTKMVTSEEKNSVV
jgi:hypothetical protein